MPVIEGCYASLKGSAKLSDILQYVKYISKDGNIIGLDEVYSRRTYRAIKKRIGSGWGFKRIGEYVLMWRKSLYKAVKTLPGRLIRMSHVHKGRDKKLDLWVAVKHLIRIADNKRVICMVGHTPAGVEMGDGWNLKTEFNRKQVRAHQDGTLNWGEHIAKVEARRPKAIIVAMGDGNLDQKRQGWLAYMESQLDIPSAFHGKVIGQGSFGGRMIDFMHSNTNPEYMGAKAFPHKDLPDSLDHDAIRFWIKR